MPVPAHRDPDTWEKDSTLLENPDEALLAFGGFIFVGVLFLLTGVFLMTALCAVGVYWSGRHLLDLGEDGQRYRALGRATTGHILDSGGGQVGVLVDETTDQYPVTGRRCRLYTGDE